MARADNIARVAGIDLATPGRCLPICCHKILTSAWSVLGESARVSLFTSRSICSLRVIVYILYVLTPVAESINSLEQVCTPPRFCGVVSRLYVRADFMYVQTLCTCRVACITSCM